jgi:sugar/nucleoside kinase (ribokinase family)
MTPARWLASAPEPRFSLTVLGEVRIEMRAHSPAPFTSLSADRLVYAPVRPLVAGTAVNLARHASDFFKSVSVLGRIGDDAFTPVIQDRLRDLGVTDLLQVDPDCANGCSIMLWDPSVRLLVAGDPAPRVTPSDVRAAREAIASSDLLFADGYALLDATSRAALLEAVQIARSTGTRVAFDLVPHDLPARIGPESLIPVLACADVVITEMTTVSGLLGKPAELLPALDRLVAHAPLWLLRHPGMDRTLAYQRGEIHLEYPTENGTGEEAGFGDRLAAGELYWWLSQR